MRVLSYTELPGVGPCDLEKKGTVVDLLIDLPYFVLAEELPTFEAMNELFAMGVKDAGMSGGCAWEPFQINPEEYKEIVKALLADPRMEKLHKL